jgi:4-diphosphocytidyl-2-C-methyl-D-erythritol kinase
MIRVMCPAKLNLFLSVGPRDQRGYHPLRTVFQAVSLFDVMTIARAAVDSFECNWRLPENNTVSRAWSLLRELVPLPPLQVTLEKSIPCMAGMGGGSSDAAGLIRGVQSLLGLRIPAGELKGLAMAIGSDVPFFLTGGRAKAEGYGEKLTPLPDPKETWTVVVKPKADCSTREMYEALDTKAYPWLAFNEDDGLYNDFERVAPCECLDLVEALQMQGATASGLSGSGSAVFGLVPDRESAERIASGYEQAYALRFITRAESLEISQVKP